MINLVPELACFSGVFASAMVRCYYFTVFFTVRLNIRGSLGWEQLPTGERKFNRWIIQEEKVLWL